MTIFNLQFAIEKFPAVLEAVPMTLTIAFVAMAFGMVLGFLLALCRIYKIPVLNRLTIIYVSFIRGTPLLVQLYVLFYGLPLCMETVHQWTGLHMPAAAVSPLAYALVAYTVNSTAYQSEIIRSSLKAIDIGQMEAAYACGMTTAQGLWRIVIPQALRIALPNFGNVFIGLIKGTSLVFAVKVVEIMAVAKVIAGDGYRFLEMYFDASVLYWIICFLCERAIAVLEKKLSAKY